MSSHVRYGTAGWIGFGFLTLTNIVSTTFLIWFASQGRSVLIVFPFCLGNWGSYLLSHYLVEGEFIDRSIANQAPEKSEDRNSSWLQAKKETITAALPASRFHQTLGVIGISGMFLTFPTGIVAVSQNDFWLLFLSATLFVVGYIVGHQGFTKKPL